MNTPIRSLPIFFGFLWALAVAGSLPAQSPEEEIPMIEVSVCKITEDEMPDMFLLNEEKKFVPLPVGSFSRGTGLEVPRGESLVIYTGTFNDAEEPDMKPLFSVKTGQNQEQALVLLYHNFDGSIGHTIIDDSAEAHPARSVRVINVSPYPMTFIVGDERKNVPPNEQAVASPRLDENGRFPFVYRSVIENDQVYTAPVKNLTFRRDNSRLLILYTALKEVNQTDPDDPDKDQFQNVDRIEYVPTAFRIYDQI